MASKSKVKKVVAKKAPAKKVVKDDGIYWVVLQKGLWSAKVVALKRTRLEAQAHADALDSDDWLSYNRYVVQRVELSLGS